MQYLLLQGIKACSHGHLDVHRMRIQSGLLVITCGYTYYKVFGLAFGACEDAHCIAILWSALVLTLEKKEFCFLGDEKGGTARKKIVITHCVTSF